MSTAKPDLSFRYDGITALEKSLTGDLIVRTAQSHFTENRPVSYQMIDGKRREVESWFDIVSASEYRIAIGPYDKSHELVIDPVLDWSTFLGKANHDAIRDVKIDPAGNICVAGNAFSTDLPATAGFDTGPGVNYDPNLNVSFSDVFVAKLNSSGTAMLWLGYLAGNGMSDEWVNPNGLAVDSAGNLYVGGYTASADFPVLNAFQSDLAGLEDAFVTKIKFDGSAILWSSLLGGTNAELGWGITLDSQENVFLTGHTLSDDFPTTVGAFDTTLGGAQDAFVTKFDASGALQWSSYLGGAGGDERAAGLAADANGNVVVFGDTQSADFPVTTGAFDTTLGGTDDAFVTKIRADGSAILWSTFLGGSGPEIDQVHPAFSANAPRGDIVLDSAGAVLVAGETLSADFPTTAGAFDRTLSGGADGYVAKISADGASLIWASYLGGSGGGEYRDTVHGIAVNPWDEVLVVGRTDSSDFPVIADAPQKTFQGGLQDGFLTKLSVNGSTVLYSTYLGGSQGRDVAIGLVYDSGNVFVGGWTTSASFPETAGAYQTGCVSCSLNNGWDDGYVMKFLDAFIAQDGFESGNYTGGSGDWTGGRSASGDISILTSATPHSGTRHVRLRSSTGYLQRALNLPPASVSVRLGFWAKVDSFEGSDQAVVLAKSTGANFTPVFTFTSAQSDNQYHYYELDLTSFLPATQIQIAFDAAMNAINDNWYLDDIRLTGTQGSLPPVANAGADQTVTDNDNSGAETVTLNGSASSDPDGGGIVAYEWKEGTTVLGSNLSISPSLSVGVHTITLTVTDDEGATGTDTVQVTVNPYLAPVEVFFDSFEVSEWDGKWIEDSQNDWSRSSALKTAGTWSAEVVGPATDSSLTSVAINLQGRNHATITFDWRIESTLDTGEYLQLQVSTNGGSIWSQQAILRGDVDPENTWRSVTVELSGISQLKLQFLGKMNKSDERANLDNVRVVAH